MLILGAWVLCGVVAIAAAILGLYYQFSNGVVELTGTNFDSNPATDGSPVTIYSEQKIGGARGKAFLASGIVSLLAGLGACGLIYLNSFDRSDNMAEFCAVILLLLGGTFLLVGQAKGSLGINTQSSDLTSSEISAASISISNGSRGKYLIAGSILTLLSAPAAFWTAALINEKVY